MTRLLFCSRQTYLWGKADSLLLTYFWTKHKVNVCLCRSIINKYMVRYSYQKYWLRLIHTGRRRLRKRQIFLDTSNGVPWQRMDLFTWTRVVTYFFGPFWHCCWLTMWIENHKLKCHKNFQCEIFICLSSALANCDPNPCKNGGTCIATEWVQQPQFQH